MLIGSPGARKSTAIKQAKKLLLKTSANIILAADKTSKEKMLVDMALAYTGADDVTDIDANLWGTGNAGADEETTDSVNLFIAADEFNDFIGNSNLEFISLLGNLWDYSGLFKYRTKSGTEVFIPNPNLCILGGNTPVNFNTAFPPETLGQGFFSRLLLIYGESSGKKITFPTPPSPESTSNILHLLESVNRLEGEMQLSREAISLLDRSYKGWKRSDDTRLVSYSERRFTHLLKIVMIHAASRYSMMIEAEDVILGNSVLSYAEHYMPTAFGEFGRSKNSDVNNRIITLLEHTNRPLEALEIFELLSKDVADGRDMGSILQNMVIAKKIQFIPKQGFLLQKKVLEYGSDPLVNYKLLTTEELFGKVS